MCSKTKFPAWCRKIIFISDVTQEMLKIPLRAFSDTRPENISNCAKTNQQNELQRAF